MRLFWHQLRGEQLVFWRSREAAVFVFLFPLILFALLTALYNGEIYGKPAPWALLAGMLGYGAANTAFAGLALIIVARREMGILERIRSTPLPAATDLVAVLASILVVFALQALALFTLGSLLESTPWPSNALSLAAALLLGASAFAGLGLAISSVIRSVEGSSAVINIVLLPMAFLSGSLGRPPTIRSSCRRSATSAAEVPRRRRQRDLPAGEAVCGTSRRPSRSSSRGGRSESQ